MTILLPKSLFLHIIMSWFHLDLSFKYDLTITRSRSPLSLNKNSLRSLNYNLDSDDEIYNILTTRICFGLPQQCFDLLYDTGMMYTIIGDINGRNSTLKKRFNCSLSTTYQEKKIGLISVAYRNGLITSRIASDYVTIAEKQEHPSHVFSFLISFNTTANYDFDGILGWGYWYPSRDTDESASTFDNRYSLIDYLYSNDIIKKKIFGHEYSTRTSGNFYIDEVPESMRKGHYSCKVEPFIPFWFKWHCTWRSIFLSNGNNFTWTQSPVAFDTGYTDIRGPWTEGEWWFDNMLKYANNKCKIESYQMTNEELYKKIICSDSFKQSSFPDLFFNLNGFKWKLKNEDMFRLVEINGEIKYAFKIIIDSRYHYWNWGEPVLKNYDMMFDYDTASVGFKENLNYYDESWTGVILLALVLVGWVGAMIYVYINRKWLFLKTWNEEEIMLIKKQEAYHGEQLGEIR